MQSKLLTTKQASNYLGVPHWVLERSRVKEDKPSSLQGDWPAHIKVGKARVRYWVDELDRWVERKAAEATQSN